MKRFIVPCGLAGALVIGLTAWQIPKTTSELPGQPCGGSIIAQCAHSWGLRRVASAYTGVALNLRRDSDSATQDFNILADGTLDTASITTFCSGANCFATKVYDQISTTACTTACDLAQATAAAQPTYVASCTPNGKPCLRVTAATVCMVSPTNTTVQAQPLSISAVVNHTFSANSRPILGQTGGGSITPMIAANNSTTLRMVAGGTTLSKAYTSGSWYSWQSAFDGASSVIRLNGSDTSGTVGSNGFNNSQPWVMGGATCATSSTFDWTEGSIYTIALDGTQRADIETNQRDYWGF